VPALPVGVGDQIQQLRNPPAVSLVRGEIDASYRTLRRRIEQFTGTLDAPSIQSVGPVEVNEVYVSAGLRGGSPCAGVGPISDKPSGFTLGDRSTGQRHVVSAKAADESTVRLLSTITKRSRSPSIPADVGPTTHSTTTTRIGETSSRTMTMNTLTETFT
jgi:hypothetical protein